MVKKKMTIDDLAAMTQKEFVTIHKKFATVNKKLGEHDKQFDKIESRLGNVESRLDGLDAKVDNVQELNMKVLAALDENTTILRDIRDEMASTSSILVSHEKRITTLEEKVEVGK